MNPIDPATVATVGAAVALAKKPLEKLTEAVIRGAEAVLGRICLPAAEEYGLLLRDRMKVWRAKNLLSLTEKLERKLIENKVPEGDHAAPRLVSKIVEEATWIDDSMVQDMWAGLLSSSCTESGNDDSNLIFANLLGSLTKLEARVLNFACDRVEKHVDVSGLAYPVRLVVPYAELCQIAQENDIQRLDRELDHLRALMLLEGGLAMHAAENHVFLTPTSLALHMYIRCSGSRATPAEFFRIQAPTTQGFPPPPIDTSTELVR
jgi:hypothetical protein